MAEKKRQLTVLPTIHTKNKKKFERISFVFFIFLKHNTIT